MYRRDTRNGSRCQVPHSLYLARGALLDGLAGAEAFAEKLSQELQCILGSVGVNATMSQLHRDVGVSVHLAKTGVCSFVCAARNFPLLHYSAFGSPPRADSERT